MVRVFKKMNYPLKRTKIKKQLNDKSFLWT